MSPRFKAARSFFNAPRFFDKFFALCRGGLEEARRVAREITTFIKRRKDPKKKPFRLAVETLETRVVPTGQPYVALDYKEISYFHNTTLLSSSATGGGLDPTAWPSGADCLPTEFHVYGFQSSTLGDEIAGVDPTTGAPNGLYYAVQSDMYGYYIDLGGPEDVNININLLNTSLPNADVPGIAIDQQTKTITYEGETGPLNAVGFQHWTHGNNSSYRSFVDAQMTVVNTGGLITAVNKNLESFENYGYIDYDAEDDGVRIDDLASGVNDSASAGSAENPDNFITREQYAVPTNAAQILSTTNTSDDTMWLVYGTTASTVVTSSLNPSVYGDAVTFTATVTPSSTGLVTPTGTVTFYDGSTDLGTETLNGSGVATYSTSSLVAATHPITAVYNGDSDYLPDTSAVLSQVVTPAPLTITAANKSMVYGSGALPTFTVSYSGFENGDHVGNLTDPAIATTTATASSPAGTYPITPSGAVDSNYTFIYVDGTLTITKAPLTVSADDKAMELYGPVLPPLTFTASGFVNGDTNASMSGALATTATAASPLGAYPITKGTLADPNYTITFTPGTLYVIQTPNATLVPIGEAEADVTQGALRLQQPLDFDLSPGTSVGGDPVLTYNSATVDVMPIIQVSVTVTDSHVDTIQLILTWDGTVQSPVTFAVPGGYVLGTPLTLAVQDATPVAKTGLYAWNVEVDKLIGSTTHTHDASYASGATPVVVEDSSVTGQVDPYGAGWGITGISRLVPLIIGGSNVGVLWVDGSGDSEFFAAGLCGVFTTPAQDFGTLTYSCTSGEYTYIDPYKTTSTYDGASGLLTSVVDKDGLGLYYGYDGGGLASVSAPDTSTTTLDYDGGGFLTEIDEPGGRTITLNQAHSGAISDPTSITDADGNVRFLGYDSESHVVADEWSPYVTGFEYGATGLLDDVDLGDSGVSDYDIVPAASQGIGAPGIAGQATITDPLSDTTVYTVDGSGREIQEVDPLGDTQTWTRTTAGLIASYTDADGNTTAYGYDSSGDVTSEVDPNGGVTSYGYDPVYHEVTFTSETTGTSTIVTSETYTGTGDLATSIDGDGYTTTYDYAADELLSETTPLGDTTAYGYDGYRRLVLVDDPDGDVTATAYDTNGNIATVTDPDGYPTAYDYDANNQLLSVTDPTGDVNSTSYTAAGLVSTTTDGRGTVSSTSYDSRGFVTATAIGTETTTFTNDAAGNATKSVDPMGYVTTYEFNAADEETEATDPDGYSSYTMYDHNGNVTETIDDRGEPTYTDYDSMGDVVDVVDALGYGTGTYYNLVGWVTETTDAMGHPTEMYYDADGNVTKTVDPLGNATTDTYNADDLETLSVDPRGLATTTAYDPDGNVLSVTSPGPQYLTTSYGYDRDGNVTSMTDPRGLVTTTTYDEDDRESVVTDPAGDATTTVYDADSEVVGTIDGDDGDDVTGYDIYGDVTFSGEPLGNGTTTYYNADNEPTLSIDGDSDATTTSFDPDGYVTKVVDPMGFITLDTNDKDGDPTLTTDPMGLKTTTTYDADNEPTAVTDPMGYTTHTGYNGDGDVVSTTDALGGVTSTGYNADEEVTSVTDPLARTTLTAYDADGEITSSTDAAGNVTQTQFNTQGWATEVIDPRGDATTTTYDNDGNPSVTTDPDGHSTTDTYDDDNRLISVTDPDGDSTDYGYNKDGDQTSVTDSDGNTTTEVYDLDDRLISSTSPIETTSYTYDGDDNMLSQITPDGTNAGTYDADGRKTSETLTGDLRTFTYDEDGDMLTAGNVEGSYTFTYDNDNRVIGVSEPFGVSLTYGLDADGDQTTVTDSFGGSETSTYDADGEVLSRSYSGESQALTMNFTYTALGQVATETDIGSSGTIATTLTTYDADSDITGVTTTNSGGTINAFSYVYDPAGNETSETDNGVTTTYTYDAAGQLTGANSTTYSYDSDGNDDNSGDSDGTDNELLSDGTNNYTYDSAGNEVSKTNIATGDVWTYYYNSQNAMTQALETTSPGTGGVMEQDIFYRYDAFGNMIQKEVVTGGMSGTDTITDYAVDGWNPALAGATGNSNFNTWAVLNVSGSSTSLQTRNLFGDQVDEIIARIDQAGASDSAGVYWDLTDKLGSVRTVLNGGGTVVDTINYDAYGNTTSETTAADQGMYGWTGQEKDLETGLQYNNARWYDSSTGRWISQDPLGFDAGDSNLYRYVNNAPTDELDPSGMAQAVAPAVTDQEKKELEKGVQSQIAGKGDLLITSNYSAIRQGQKMVVPPPVIGSDGLVVLGKATNERNRADAIRSNARAVPEGVAAASGVIIELTSDTNIAGLAKAITNYLNANPGMKNSFKMITIAGHCGSSHLAATPHMPGVCLSAPAQKSGPATAGNRLDSSQIMTDGMAALKTSLDAAFAPGGILRIASCGYFNRREYKGKGDLWTQDADGLAKFFQRTVAFSSSEIVERGTNTFSYIGEEPGSEKFAGWYVTNGTKGTWFAAFPAKN